MPQTAEGREVLPWNYVEGLREADRKRANPRCIIAQRGCQEKFLASNSDITIFGGARGPGKTFSLLLETLRDICNPHFNSVILRAEKGDFKGIIEKSSGLYSQFGTYNRAQNDMTWNFTNGGKQYLTYFSDPISDFKKRFQGQEYSYIGIDEITHITYEKFQYLKTTNRNPWGIRNRIYGTCNPDPDSWVRRFIDWWIGEDGYPIEARDGVRRYCFMGGSTPEEIVWGDTALEVYKQCKDVIDGQWKPAFSKLGFDKVSMFVKSVTFIRGKLEENTKLLSSDPAYLANLVQQDEEQRARDLDGNWNFRNTGDDMLKMGDMERWFDNAEQLGDKHRRCSCDIAFSGGDSLVMWLWIGNHVEDVFVCRTNAKKTIALVKTKLEEWGVREEDFVYDLNGLGQTFKGFFPRALPFNNMAAPEGKTEEERKRIKYVYANLKSQCAYLFVRSVQDGEMSINSELLAKKFSGDGYENLPLRQILMKERKALRADENASDKGFRLIGKPMMKHFVGHSPDYIESLLMFKLFTVRRTHVKPRGLWRL